MSTKYLVRTELAIQFLWGINIIEINMQLVASCLVSEFVSSLHIVV